MTKRTSASASQLLATPSTQTIWQQRTNMQRKVRLTNPWTGKKHLMLPDGLTAKRIYKYMIEETGVEPDAILPDSLVYRHGRFYKLTPVSM